MVSLAGRLLLAVPTLSDPNFSRTVVHVLVHDDSGAFGLVVNRPSHTEVEEILPQWRDYVGGPPVVFIGGPVQPDGVIALVRTDARGEGLVMLRGDIGTVDLDKDPLEVPTMSRLRLFAGYSGWSPGQLEAEVALGGWLVLDATDDDPFNAEPWELWREVLNRQPGEVSWLARFPDAANAN
jgi:putative transcriptional regulator